MCKFRFVRPALVRFFVYHTDELFWDRRFGIAPRRFYFCLKGYTRISSP